MKPIMFLNYHNQLHQLGFASELHICVALLGRPQPNQHKPAWNSMEIFTHLLFLIAFSWYKAIKLVGAKLV